MKITFDQAQKALGHLQKNRQGRPPLLSLRGKDRAIKIYQLKTDLKDAFSVEIDRFTDLVQEADELRRTETESEKKKKQINKKIQQIEDEAQELFTQERELELKAGKLDLEEIEDVITADILNDLEFAINMNGKDEFY